MKIRQEVLAVLSRMDMDGGVLKITDGQLDRKLYVDVNKVLEAMGGKWNRKLQGHVFPDDPMPLLDSVILTGEIVAPKDDLGFFPTPPSLAARIIRMAEIEPGDLVLEPSAGTGNLYRALLDVMMPELVRVDMVEINEKFVEQLRASRGPGSLGHTVHHADFLKCNGELGAFDRVVMNPPFAKQADIDHVLHAWRFVAPGGRLVSIMSAGVAFRENRKTIAFRDFVSEHGGEITPNPAGSFKPSGTDVSTVTLIMDKSR